MNIFSLVKIDFLQPPSPFYTCVRVRARVCVRGRFASTYVVSPDVACLGTTYDVTSCDDL
jgi:hypothetical protein